MLLAHGAIPDIRDKSGDTPECYAAEWENTECVEILKEATAAKQEANREMSVMFDSDENDDSDEDDDDDESSMMNWIMPPPSLPNNNVNVVTKPPCPLPDVDDSSVHISVHLQPPAQTKKISDASDASLPDLSVTNDDEHVVVDDDDSDTESEDTMKLMQESAAIKSYKDSRSPNRTSNHGGGMSIVDKIKNNLQNSKQEQAEIKQTSTQVSHQVAKVKKQYFKSLPTFCAKNKLKFNLLAGNMFRSGTVTFSTVTSFKICSVRLEFVFSNNS